MRARQKFFWNRKIYKILYLLHIFDFFISFKLMVLKSIEVARFFAKKRAPAWKRMKLPLKLQIGWNSSRILQINFHSLSCSKRQIHFLIEVFLTSRFRRVFLFIRNDKDRFTIELYFNFQFNLTRQTGHMLPNEKIFSSMIFYFLFIEECFSW